MSALLNLLYLRFKPYFPVVYALLVFALIVAITYYVYNYVYLPKIDEQKSKETGSRSIIVYMFHVDWCPHCKRALPEWTMFSQEYNGKQINGYQVECKELNCTDPIESAEIKAMVAKYKVEHFPTIFALIPKGNGNEVRIDYDAKVKKANLDKFIVSATSS